MPPQAGSTGAALLYFDLKTHVSAPENRLAPKRPGPLPRKALPMNPAAQSLPEENAAVPLLRPAGMMLLAVLLLVLLGGLGSFLLLARAQAVRSAEVTAENLVQVIEAQVAGDLGRLESLLRYAATEFDPERISRLPAAERAVLSRRIAQLLHDFPAAGGLNLFDSQGWLLLSDQAERVPFSIADRPHFQAMRSNTGLSTVYSDALAARSSGAWSLVLSRAVRSSDGRLLGLVNAPMNLEAHARLFARLNVGRYGVTLMRRSDTFQLIQRVPRMSEADFNQPLPESNAIRQRVAAGGQRFTLHYAASVDGLARIGSVRVLKQFPFYVQVALAEEDFLAAWRRQAAWSSALTLLLLAAFGLAALRLRRSELAAAAALAAQAEADQRVRLALSGGDLGLWDWHIPSGRVVFNERWCAMLGYALSEVKPHVDSWGELVHPEDWPVIKAALEPHLRGETALYECEHRMRHKDGRWVWILDRGKVVRRNAAGGALRAVGTHMDISGRKAAEQALAESEERLRALFDIFPDGILLIDPQTTMPTVFNPLAHQQLGYTAEEFARLPIRAYEAAETPEEIAARSAAILQQGRADFETTHRRKDGSLLPVQVTVLRVSLRGAMHFLCVMRDISERKAAEQNLKTALAELERERSFLKTLIRTLPDLIWLKDADGVYLACNPAFERFFGMAEAEIVGRTDYDFVSREQAEMFRANDRRAMLADRPQVNEEWITFAADGSRVLLETTKMPMRGQQGRLIGVLGIGHDITRTRRLEEKLRAERDLKQSYLDTVEAVIVSLDRSGLITMINRKGCELLGWPEEELRGAFWFERCLVQPQGLTEAYPAFADLIAGRQAVTGRFENRILTRSGEARLIAWRVSCLRDEQGDIVGTLSAGEDVTERKAAEQELRRISKLMRMILDSASEGICGLDRQGRTIFINRAGAAMLGWQPEELLGRCQHQIAHHRKADGAPYPEEDCPASRCCWDGQPREVTDELLWRKDGSSFPAEYVASPIIDSDGGITGAMLVFRSLSERVALCNDLARSNAELEQFAYAASHDLRQPLRMIANFLQLLHMELEATLTDAQKEYIQFAVSGAKRLDTMLLGLLEYSRVGRAGEPSVWLESRAVLDEALLFLRPAVDEAGAAVRVAGDWPRLKASPDGLLRLLQNLIGNALKFRLPGQAPEVTVSGELLADRWRLTVADKGIGLPPNQRDRLFQVFSRLRTKGEYEGTGIGLAVARKIAEQHGGGIRAESPGEGLGSSFVVELRLAADAS